jgi:hypothetical protein
MTNDVPLLLQGKADAKKSKIYGKIGKNIIRVVKSGGPGMDMATSLPPTQHMAAVIIQASPCFLQTLWVTVSLGIC